MARVVDSWWGSGWMFIVGNLSLKNMDEMLEQDIVAYMVFDFLLQGSC